MTLPHARTDPRPLRSLWPRFGEAEIEAVADILRSGRVNAWTGPTVSAFEEAYARSLERAHAVAVANGTAALEAALVGLGIGAGDEVIVTPRSFFASAASVAFVGATPVFADVDRDSQNLTARSIVKKVTERTAAVIVVHLAGWPAEMRQIMSVARAHGIAVIEDCAQAHGALIDGRPVGSFGDVATFSFCQDKIISTGGEGGLIAMDDPSVFRRVWGYKDHGKSYDRVHRSDPSQGFRWLHEDFGTNLRMTAMQAAIGLMQLDRLEETRAIRTANASLLLDALGALDGLRVPRVRENLTHAYYRAYAFVRRERMKPQWDRDRIVREVTARGVPCFSGSCSEIYRETAFAKAGLAPRERLPIARELGETSLAFQVDPTFDRDDMALVAEIVTDVLEAATLDTPRTEPRGPSAARHGVGAPSVAS